MGHGIVRDLCRPGSVLARMVKVIFARMSTKERGTEHPVWGGIA